MRWTDRLIFGLTNAWLYLARPRLVLRYRKHVGAWPNFATPRGLGELVQWRKLFDRNPAFVVFADKLAAKAWIAERAPELAIPETVWVGTAPEAIPDHLLTLGHVIKTNNASGTNYLPHRQPLPRAEVERMFRRWLFNAAMKPRLGWLEHGQEWAYWQVPPRLFVERLVLAGERLVDIAVRVMDGKVMFVSCALDHKTDDKTLGYFHPDGTPLENTASTLPADFRAPACLARAVATAERLGRGYDYLRIDFLAAGDNLYASEITIYPAAGFTQRVWWTGPMYRAWLRALDVSWPLTTAHRGLRRIYMDAFRRWLHERRAEAAE